MAACTARVRSGMINKHVTKEQVELAARALEISDDGASFRRAVEQVLGCVETEAAAREVARRAGSCEVACNPTVETTLSLVFDAFVLAYSKSLRTDQGDRAAAARLREGWLPTSEGWELVP